MSNNELSKTAEEIMKIIGKTINQNLYQIEYLFSSNNHWEKWFQVELASRLNQSKFTGIKLEKPYYYDLRKSQKQCYGKTRKKGQIDIVAKVKYGKLNQYIGFELKQSNNIGGLKGVIKDINKIRTIKKSEWNFRALYFVLVYKDLSCKRALYSKLREKLHSNGFIRDLNIQFKNTTGLYAFVLYWEEDKSNRAYESFNDWYRRVMETVKEINS